jgi:hypothetical protein
MHLTSLARGRGEEPMNNTSYRMNITIPQRLKAQMDKLAEQVNWSNVAAEAFQRKIVEVQSARKRTMTKEKLIDRLRKAGKDDLRGYETGHAAGRSWAETKALPRHLRNLERIQEKGFDEVYKDDEDPGSPWGPADMLALNIDEGIMSLDQCREFWKEACEGDASLIHSRDFARGLVAGAAEVWEEVKNDL